MKIPADQRNRYKYCDFHEDVGHNTSECYSLRNQIEGLVRGGLLVEFLQQIIFTEDDAYNTVQPHDDPMVITVQIANCRVHHILIDTGSSVDILFKGALEKLNLKNPCYNSYTTPLYGFTGDSVMPIKTHILPVIIGEAPLQQNIMIEFIMVDTPSAYNVILGRPFLSGIRGVLSIYHNDLKFPVGTKVGEVRGDQQAARTCYAVSTNPIELAKQCAHVTSEPSHMIPKQEHYVLEEGEVPDMIIEEKEDEERGWTGGYPAEQLEEIPIRKGDPTKVVKIGGVLDYEVRKNLVDLLEEYNDIFAWSHDEMPGIPFNLATHRLAVDAIFKQVKQKRRHFNAEQNAVVQEEVDKLLKARFIRESRYLEWIANVVMVTKANGKWRMCVVYIDLNRACPKDSFPLPKID
ncbi:hypothetical protein LWI29_015920 [Acer saccharum]|uniref:Reverse transcriptase domain-containing protein n=1 Tax=Acer saccharum TaxID=4024 RepID=A0AA39SA19_ACESA|nr:hypothetical protein LWI29_015920 [Acer saccharum]